MLDHNQQQTESGTGGRSLCKHPRIARVAGGTATELNHSLANSIKRAVIRHFSSIIPVLEGERDVTIHNLRGVYGQIAVHFFCLPSQGVARFVQERLGHVIASEERKRGNASATQHYFHYYLIDGDGKHIGSRGVKLPDGEALPVLEESTPAIAHEDFAEKQSAPQPALVSAIASLAEQLQSLTQENQRIWQHINTMTTAAPAPTPADTGFFTREIEALRQQLAALELERDQAAAALEQARGESESLQQQFSQERLAYQQRIEVLTDLLRQAPPTAQIVPPQSVEAPTTAVKESPAPAPQIYPAPPVEPVQPKPRRERTTRAGTADQRVEAAMRAVMQWNREQASDRERFAITQSLLQRTTGSNMPAVKRVMEAFKNEIHEHNSQYALDPDRHNYGRDLAGVKEFVQNRL